MTIGIADVTFLGINKRGQPEIRAGVHAPTVKMEIQIGECAAGIGAVESNDRVVLVLDPDAPDEAPFARLLLWSYVKDERAHFPEEFAADVIEIVVLRVQAAVVEVNHLQKTVRQKLRAEIEKPGSCWRPCGAPNRRRAWEEA